MQIVSQPLPSINLRHTQTRITIGKRQEKVPPTKDNSKDNDARSPSTIKSLSSQRLSSWETLLLDDLLVWCGSKSTELLATSRAHGLWSTTLGNVHGGFFKLKRLDVEDELDEPTGNETGGDVCWKIVMQEKLSAHQVEWEVVQSPGKEEESSGVIQSVPGSAIHGIDAPAEGDLVGTNDTSVDRQKRGSDPPSKWVTKEVNLLASIILSPERNTAQQKWPLEWLRCIWMRASQRIVVRKHGSLQLKPLLQKWHMLDLPLLLFGSLIVWIQRWNVIHIPDVAGLGKVLVSVDLLLLEGPFWEWLSVSPHGDLAWVVDDLDEGGEGAELLVVLAILNADLEESVVIALSSCILVRYGGKLLIGRIVWRGNIV